MMSSMAFKDRRPSRAARDYADFLLPHLGNQTHLLDLGCGDGTLTVELPTVCGRTTALDLSADELRAAATASQGLGQLTFVQGDATHLPFLDGTFDAALAHSVLESGVEPARVLAEAWRVLRPGGRLGVASVEYGAFARGRALECSDAASVAEAVEADLTTELEMAEMSAAWSASAVTLARSARRLA